jgi:beta-1,4-glucosyltransferase
MRTERLLETDFTVGDAEEIGAFIERKLGGGGAKLAILHGNVHTLYIASKYPILKRTIAGPDTLLLFEGIGLELSGFLSHGKWWPSVNGTDLVPKVLARSRQRPLRLALVGGRPGVAEAAAKSLTEGLDQVVVVATSDGFADRTDEQSLLADLARAKPDLVLVGLGTPLQELKATAWTSALEGPLFWAVGGLFDYHAGRTVRAPVWIRHSRLEWAWRLLTEPLRLWDRYFFEALWLLRTLLRQAVRDALRPELSDRTEAGV